MSPTLPFPAQATTTSSSILRTRSSTNACNWPISRWSDQMPATKYFQRFAVALFAVLVLCHGAGAQAPMAPSLPPSSGQQGQSDLLSTPLTLDRVIDRFLQRNLSVEAARYQVEAARAEQIAARIRS